MDTLGSVNPLALTMARWRLARGRPPGIVVRPGGFPLPPPGRTCDYELHDPTAFGDGRLPGRA